MSLVGQNGGRSSVSSPAATTTCKWICPRGAGGILSCLLGTVWSWTWKSARWSNARGQRCEGSYGKSWICVREEQKTLDFLVLSCPQWLLSSPITHDLPVIDHSGNKTLPLEPNTASSSERTEKAYCFSKALYPNDLDNLGILVKLCTMLRLLGTGIQSKVHN